jgi:hypothetical protein
MNSSSSFVPVKTYFGTLLLLFLLACSTEGKKINKNDWEQVKNIINNRPDLHEKKRMFVVDRIDEIVNDKEELYLFKEYSFSELINRYSLRYDSLNTLYKSIRKTNSVLNEVLDLEKAESVSLDADRGFIVFTLNFNKVFEDSVDYMILTYKYIDDYDNTYFSESSKLSHQAAGSFSGKMQSVMTDIFNGQNEIIYLKTDLSAAEVLQKSYGVSDSTETLEKEYLSEGLKVMVSAVKFQNGGLMKRLNGNWKYLSE